jgi:hypothetical protein
MPSRTVARTERAHPHTELTPALLGLATMGSEPELFDEPTKVFAKDGEVILDGPDGVDVKLTPEAARETSNRLWDGAAKAKVQKSSRKLPRQR